MKPIRKSKPVLKAGGVGERYERVSRGRVFSSSQQQTRMNNEIRRFERLIPRYEQQIRNARATGAGQFSSSILIPQQRLSRIHQRIEQLKTYKQNIVRAGIVEPYPAVPPYLNFAFVE